MCMSGTDSELFAVRRHGLELKSDDMMCDAEETRMFVRELLRESFLPYQQCRV